VKECLVLYHANCLDGFGAAYAAWKKLGNLADYIPVNYNEDPPNVEGKHIFIVDFSYPRHTMEEMAQAAKSIRVIDHHKTAAEALAGLPYAIFDMNKSGAVLAWEFFNPETAVPSFLHHVQDRDLWKFEYTNTRPICEAARNLYAMDFKTWDAWCTEPDEYTPRLASQGTALLIAFNNDIDKLLDRKHSVSLFGVEGLACNATPKYASELGNQLAKRSGTFGLVYSFDGPTKTWQCSLRSIGDFDVSVLAKEFDGGGHKNAAGFSTPSIIW
jgi:nanoRNase/pAp phosphatase (c-di-AMP/oligoRNAs hydrolase)